ncbi:MAG TPA: hypothetical protein VNX68_05335, partial [Nitrosopumilaceae archaeon]|nr:hypothetical protein [Nitrosopumilaceae archaeon]
IISAILVLCAGFYAHFGWVYWIGCLFFCGLLAYQHSLVKPNDLSKVNLAFATTNGVASVVFAVFTCTEILI